MKTQTQIHIRKEHLKFSAAHMTVFPDGTKERLHGHNYFTEVVLEWKDTSFNQMVSFSEIKKSIKEICESFDERVLLPESCPFLEKIKSDKSDTEFKLCGKRYVLPTDELVWLPVETVSSESLSRLFLKLLSEKLVAQGFFSHIARIEVKIEETPGQGATSYALT